MIKLFASSRRNPRQGIEGKSVLINGGSRGLGLLLARDFGRLGARVVICARDEAELTLARRRLEDWGVSVETRVCDLRDREATRALVSDVEARYGGIDYLVNNAGVIQIGPIDTLDVSDFEDAMDTMFWGVVVPSLAALEGMRRRRFGRIVNITSIGGKVSFPHLLPYNASKFAALGFSEGLRAELAGTGVGVVTVVPGLMRTASFLSAEITGKPKGEFAWFSLGASLPLISSDAERAAARIVRAARDNEAELILTPLANFGARFKGLFPGWTLHIFSLVSMLLPSAPPQRSRHVRGEDVMREIEHTPLSPAYNLSKKAAEELQGSAPKQ